MSAQSRLRTAWEARDVRPGSGYDAPTSDAVAAVQRVAGLPVTGWLDVDTWSVIFEHTSATLTPGPDHTLVALPADSEEPEPSEPARFPR